LYSMLKTSIFVDYDDNFESTGRIMESLENLTINKLKS
jgi:hypothetical protein